MLKSSSCEACFSQSSESVVDSSSIADTEEFEDYMLDDTILELDIQRDEKIYRIVRHHNNQIDNLRMLGMNEDILKLMEEIERKKWLEIAEV